jgi:hypothetical protein
MKKSIFTIATAVLLTAAAPAMASHNWWVPPPKGPSMTADPYSGATWVGCSRARTCTPEDGKNRPLAHIKGSTGGYEFSSDDERAPWNNGNFGGPAN